MNESNDDLSGRYICFTLGNEKFAIPLLEVKEVIGNIDITPIPQSPAYYKGIMNLRGQVIPVIDLRLKLNTLASKEKSETVIVILDFDQCSIGVIVDSIECVSTFESKDIGMSLDIESLVKSKFILGVAKKEKIMTLIIDLRALLDIRRYQEMAAIAA